jgi:hypothetical protein
MIPWIQISPSIKRLQLKSTGCWNDLDLDFIPGKFNSGDKGLFYLR